MEQLQLKVEALLFDQDEGSQAEMIDLLGIEDDVTGKTKMQRIKIIRKEVDIKMESDEKVAHTCLEQLVAYIKGTVPPLEQTEETGGKSSGWSKERTNGRPGKVKQRTSRTRGGGYSGSNGENKSGPIVTPKRI